MRFITSQLLLFVCLFVCLFVVFLGGTLESQTRRGKETSGRTVKIEDGGTETADGEHDESKHGRIAKRKKKCCGSEQNAARKGGGECRSR